MNKFKQISRNMIKIVYGTLHCWMLLLAAVANTFVTDSAVVKCSTKKTRTEQTTSRHILKQIN